MNQLLTKTKFQKGLLVLLPILVYASTVQFKYALDDALYIKDNSFTKKGLDGIGDHLSHEALVGFYGEQKSLLTGGRYRPLAPITYSIEYALFGFKPAISHAINILLYILLLLLIYEVFIRFTGPKEGLNFLLFATLLIFAAHPLHVEVVANIKGRDQILALMAVAACFIFTFNLLQGKKWALPVIFSLFFIALLAKESAITFLPVLPLAFYFFNGRKLKEILPLFVTILAASATWFILRSAVLNGFESVESNNLLNDPYMQANGIEAISTKFYCLLIYLKLTVFPYPLTHDYYPFHIPIQGFTIWSMLSIAIHIGLIVLAIWGLIKKKAFAFWIIFYGATLSIASNFVFNIGAFMNERFLFEPSVAICIGLAFLINKITNRQAKWAVAGIFVVAFCVLSFNRSFAWKNNYTLFTTDVKTSSKSVKGLTAAGGMKGDSAAALLPNNPLKQKLLNESIAHLTHAVKLLPTDINANTLLANVLLDKLGVNERSAIYYENVLKLDPKEPNVPKNILFVLANKKYDTKKRVAFAKRFESYFTNNYPFNYQMGLSYGRELQNLPKSIEYLEKARAINPNKIEPYTDLGTAYAMSGNFQKSNEVLLMALDKSPNNQQVLTALGLNYRNMGMEEEAQHYFNQLKK